MNEETVRSYVRGEQAQGPSRRFMFLANPFTYVAGWQALGWGLLVLAATMVVAVTGRIHFDGVMDLHIAPVKAPPWFYAFEPAADWLVVAVVFWLAGAIFSRSKQRPIDYFGTTALARFPYLIAGILFLPPLLGGIVESLTKLLFSGQDPAGMSRQILGLPGLPWLIIGSLFMLVLIAWLGVLNYFALRESSGMKATTALGVFVGAAIVAEIISKLAIGLAAHRGGLF